MVEISSQKELLDLLSFWKSNFFETDKKQQLKDKLQEEQTKLLLRYMEVHEGLAIQVVKQISFLIFKLFLEYFHENLV